MRSVTLLLIAVTGLAGCGNWSDEDAAFQAAVPRREDLTLEPPSGQSQQSLTRTELGVPRDALELSDVYATVVQTARDVNGLVASITAGLDFVRTLPPTRRETGRRFWGPFPDEGRPGLEIRIEMSRASETEYHYALQWRRQGTTEFLDVVSGAFLGEHASQGQGSLTLDGDKARAAGLVEDQNRYIELSWDMRGGAASAHLDARYYSGNSLGVSYTVEKDGGGEMQFDVRTNLVGASEVLENLAIHARWKADKSGRADTSASGGDLGNAVGAHAECWDPSATRVWGSRNYNCGWAAVCGEGEAAACRL